jgi:hypothetical protein
MFPSPKSYGTRDYDDQNKVFDIIQTQVLPQTDAEYFRVDVRVKRRPDLTPKYLVAYLLRKDVYTAEVVKIDLTSDFMAADVTFEYDESSESEEDKDAEEDEQFEEEQTFDEDGRPIEAEIEGEPQFTDEEFGYAYDFVAATPVPEIPTAKAAVERLHQLASAAGLKSRMLLGADASVANYKSYLTSGLTGFVNVGHGNTGLIVLHDGTLPASWFNGLSGSPLRPGVTYFNSCKVFNDPLKAAVMKAGARTYIGGIVNLLIGPSEEVCKCFWARALEATANMGDSLKKCEKDHYPNEGAHGITGALGRFFVEKLAHAAWLHGHAAVVERPERLSEHTLYGFFARMRGKPFNSNWVHFAIPTPVIVERRRLRAGSVMIRYRTGPGCSIHAVHVWDGERRIASYNGLNLTAPNSFRWPRFEVPGHPPIKWGLGISVGLKFGDGANLPSNKLLIDFSSAGCDFVTRL